MPGTKTVKWNSDTKETILAARNALVAEGWTNVTIRETLYKLLKLPGWRKKHYDTLCVKLGQWRDAGDIPFGLWSDETGGSDYTPMTSRKLAERIDALQNSLPACLGADGYLHAIFIEHEGMVRDIAIMTDYEVAVVSSQGQLRREHLHHVVTEWVGVVDELGGNGVKCSALVDYDKGGRQIFETHKKWLKKIFDVDLAFYGITEEQVKAAKLATYEVHQIDGWAAAYGNARLRADLRTLTGVDP